MAKNDNGPEGFDEENEFNDNRSENHKFQKGNSLWRNRVYHGRDKIFRTAEDLWSAACAYFEWVDTNPLWNYDVKVVDKELCNVSTPLRRPYTIMGFTIHAGISRNYFATMAAQMADTTDEEKATKRDFMTVLETIKDVIYTQKFEGAAAGQFNANIISRDLGLTDKKEVKANLFTGDEPIEFE